MLKSAVTFSIAGGTLIFWNFWKDYIICIAMTVSVSLFHECCVWILISTKLSLGLTAVFFQDRHVALVVLKRAIFGASIAGMHLFSKMEYPW